jgi:hypothetical protein
MVREAWRADARFFCDKGNSAFLRIKSGPWKKVSLGELLGSENVWMPGRSARVYASESRYGKPFLVPYDVFRYMPTSDSTLSRPQTSDFESYELKRGWLLMTRSGRNLGPTTWVDKYLEDFALSDDMVRVSTESEDAFYVLAFLSTPTGQSLIRRDRNGSVIDHIGPAQVRELTIPLVDDVLKSQCIAGFKKAAELREAARLALRDAAKEFLRVCHLEAPLAALPGKAFRRQFTIKASQMGWRIDAEPHAPLYASYREIMSATGIAMPLGEIAEVFKPQGRYKTLYVEDERYGLRLMSGRQVAQYRPIGLKYMSPLAFEEPAEYQLQQDWLVMTADGRAEERLADSALVTKDKNNWYASGHVHRLKARQNTHPGLLYLACTLGMVQAQLKALATGSVVDALSVDDVKSVLVPYPAGARALGDKVKKAWNDFSSANEAENVASKALEDELTA